MVSELRKFQDKLSKELFGQTKEEATKLGICVICGRKCEEFKDELSKKEHAISGMCQICQDITFGGEKL